MATVTPATTAKPEVTSALADDEEVEAVSSGTPIQSIAVRPFYTAEMAYIEEGQQYTYSPVPGQPYPYENIHPVDPTLDKKYSAEFAAFKDKKRKEISNRNSMRAIMAAASNMDD